MRGPFLRELDQSRITAGELKSLLDAGASVLVIDVRHPPEIAAGTLPGALVIAFDELAARAGEVPRDRDIVFYCS